MAGRPDGKVAIVTGAGRGIGEATARAFARDGRALHLPRDVTDEASVTRVAAGTLAAFGRIDVPVNNAGIDVFHAPLDTSEAERRRARDLHPPKRIGRPDEVAMTAVFLASDEAPFINAARIVIDGGRSVLYHD